MLLVGTSLVGLGIHILPIESSQWEGSIQWFRRETLRIISRSASSVPTAWLLKC